MTDHHHPGAAPWTPTEVRFLRDRQANRTLHPYTCETHSDSPLVPTSYGWVCIVRDCTYRQVWAHPADLGRRQPLAVAPDNPPDWNTATVRPLELLEQARADLLSRTFEIRIIVGPGYKFPRERITAAAFDLFEALLSDVGASGTEVRLTGPEMGATTWRDE